MELRKKILFKKALEDVAPIREGFSIKKQRIRKMKLKALLDPEKELRAISNLLIIKKHEEDLKSAEYGMGYKG